MRTGTKLMILAAVLALAAGAAVKVEKTNYAGWPNCYRVGNGEVELKSIKVSGDDVSFTEALAMEGNEIPITYTGRITGDEIKFTRKVGDFATEQFTAKRVKAPAAGPAAK